MDGVGFLCPSVRSRLTLSRPTVAYGGLLLEPLVASLLRLDLGEQRKEVSHEVVERVDLLPSRPDAPLWH